MNNPQMTQIDTEKRDPQTYAIIGAAMEVHTELGAGFLEAVYQEALSVEFEKRVIPFMREVEIPIQYKSVVLSTRYRADFICYGEVLVERKALARLTTLEMAQVLNYLRATGLKKALLLNFGESRLKCERLVL